MKLTSTREDSLLLRAKYSLGDFFDLLDLKQEGIHLPTDIFVHSVVRRLSFICTSLRYYFIEMASLKCEVAIALSFEEIITLCCEQGLFSKDDEHMMRRLGSMHTRVTSYEESYQSLSKEMVKGAYKLALFLDQYISQQRAMRMRDQVMQAHGGKIEHEK